MLSPEFVVGGARPNFLKITLPWSFRGPASATVFDQDVGKAASTDRSETVHSNCCQSGQVWGFTLILTQFLCWGVYLYFLFVFYPPPPYSTLLTPYLSLICASSDQIPVGDFAQQADVSEVEVRTLYCGLLTQPTPPLWQNVLFLQV